MKNEQKMIISMTEKMNKVNQDKASTNGSSHLSSNSENINDKQEKFDMKKAQNYNEIWSKLAQLYENSKKDTDIDK